ncbi:hypothetical protein [Bacillus infantis]|jgi:hypothetical protein|uniref:hypothetical protein n=1 Tax=Bacillus infantis TaxID=324767 RepID=UPI00101D37FA|nr:hypothetical protein [Bacillus infantis]MCR6609160.1 hypothetical protein [Bacillus infantis]RYI27002.1 hypothetical protein EVU96_19530 [Bacillus infantis]
MTLKKIGTLPELVKAAEHADDSRLYISQEESSHPGALLGDEDSPSGSSMALELSLLLQTGSEQLYYSNKYDEEELYEADLGFLEGLKKNTDYTLLSPSDFRKRLDRAE